MSALSLSVPGMPPKFGTLLSFIRAPLAPTADAFCEWQRSLFESSRVDLEGGLAEHATKLLPLEPYPARRDLLVGTAGDEWTAFFEATPPHAWPPSGASVLQRWLNVEVLKLHVQPFTDEAVDPRKAPGFLTPGRGQRGPGLTRLEYESPEMPMTPRILALQEWYTATARYAFVQKGSAQPWEDSEHYSKRLKKDRFTTEILESYCKKLGVDVFNLEFYSGSSVFVERLVPEETS